MKIAIHHVKNSFSERWLNYCKLNKIDFKLVDCYRNDIMEQLSDCDGLLWHWSHVEPKNYYFARQLINSLETINKKVFPSFKTCWHFDDKVGQKYLLEAINAPLVPTYVFYCKKDALEWAEKTSFPKVFKLRGGAGSINVKLVNNKNSAKRLIRKAFGKGFHKLNRKAILLDKYIRFTRKHNAETLIDLLKGIVRLVVPTPFERRIGKEKGYIYFQDFVPNNNYDIRIVVIGKKAFGIRRDVRANSFRASGSGLIKYNPELIDERCIKISFNIAEQLESQCIALDFLFDKNQNPLVLEISYGFMKEGYDPCPGFWDANLVWHEGKFNAQYFIIEDFINSIESDQLMLNHVKQRNSELVK